MVDERARLRIGELSRRVGVTPELLRAWENRYALVRPERTPGGLRLYSEGDVRRVRRMREGISRGLSAAESARLAAGAEEEESLDMASLATALLESLGRLDEPAAQAALDRIFRRLPVTVALSGVVLPVLRRVGEQWAV